VTKDGRNRRCLVDPRRTFRRGTVGDGHDWFLPHSWIVKRAGQTRFIPKQVGRFVLLLRHHLGHVSAVAEEKKCLPFFCWRAAAPDTKVSFVSLTEQMCLLTCLQHTHIDYPSVGYGDVCPGDLTLYGRVFLVAYGLFGLGMFGGPVMALASSWTLYVPGGLATVGTTALGMGVVTFMWLENLSQSEAIYASFITGIVYVQNVAISGDLAFCVCVC
jgi:Ion channel